ncbi:MAG TPA: type II toxin-antitoxin system VapB family antitoxin [Mucilaginibacter sp.]|jgi:Arc/MetJ family transcription regulator
MRITIEDRLIAKAQMLNGGKTKKATVEEALKFFIAIESQKGMSKLWVRLKSMMSLFSEMY